MASGVDTHTCTHARTHAHTRTHTHTHTHTLWQNKSDFKKPGARRPVCLVQQCFIQCTLTTRIISCGLHEYACVALLLSWNLCSRDFIIAPLCVCVYISLYARTISLDGNKFS